MKNKKIRLLTKGIVCDALIFALQFGGVSSSYAGPFKKLLDSVDQNEVSVISDREILKSSQLSYRAEGGFTGVQSFGVILSCVNGQISVMKSIYDPRLSPEKSRTREIGSMDKEAYLALWNNLDRQAILKMEDAPQPKMDIQDEFTVRFYAKVGKKYHQFEVAGISRPEASRYFAVRKLVDDTVQMQSLWDVHQDLAKNVDNTTLAQQEN